MQTQRTILWIVFSMSLLFLWDAWQRHTGQPSLFGAPPTTQSTAAESGSGAAKEGGKAETRDPSVPPAPNAMPAATIPAADTAASARSAATVVRVRNDKLSLDIDLAGGQVRRAELLAYKDSENPDARVTLLDLRSNSTFLAQSGLVGGSEQAPFPTHRTAMTVVGGEATRELRDGQADVSLTLVGESGGVRLERTLTLARGSYVLQMKDRISNTGTQTVMPVIYMQLTRDGNPPPGGSEFYSTYTGPVIYTDKDKFQKVAFSDIDKGKTQHTKTADDGWLAVIQHYFVTAWIPQASKSREYYTRKIDTNLYSVGAKTSLGEIAPGASLEHTSRLLVGPQDQRMLADTAPGLELTVDYGWLTVIAKPIYWLLERLHSMVGNWGWAIVLLTIIIKTLFYPLQAASYRSMARMKAVTPRLMALRERYGEDRVRMNQAMMELYKQEKINPLGGCLPIVVQIPVFIALYWVLLASVEMRDAPWVGWINDLAAPDPYFILPLVMAGTMFIQTKLNPTPPDPLQAKMMMILPLVFSVMFFFFPAGLVLYWLVNNIYSIAQQWLITKRFERAQAAKAAKNG
jgi:YidC/Oxa1 family membrane protein insertase